MSLRTGYSRWPEVYSLVYLSGKFTALDFV